MKSSKEKAITLIALVITIIVLLILAGVTISTLAGENGLLNRAKSSKETSINSQIEENTTLADYEIKVDEYVDGTRTESGAQTKELLYSNDIGYNSTTEPLTLVKPWTEYSELMIIGNFADATNEWDEKHISKELLEIAQQKNEMIILSSFSNFYINIKITNQTTIQCIDSRGPACIKYIYGAK